jgi:hypothetical protein
VAKKIVIIVLGALAILVSLALIGAGIALFAAFSPKGWIDTGEHRVDTPTRALVSDAADFKGAADALNSFGDFRLRVRARASDPSRALFIGVGPTATVERYLSTFRHDRVTDLNFEPFRLEKRAVGTDGVPEPPSTQPFWVQRVEGTGTQTLDWKIRDGSYEIVLMYADATPGVDTQATFGVRVPFAHGLGIVSFVVGALGLVLGIALLVVGIRLRPAAPPTPPAWPQPSDQPDAAGASPPGPSR